MEITTVEGYILSKLFEAEARAENLEAELIAKTQQADAAMRLVQRLVGAIETHRNRRADDSYPHAKADLFLYDYLDEDITLLEDPTQEMSEPTVEMPADYWEKP